jgi:hypothetical protein
MTPEWRLKTRFAQHLVYVYHSDWIDQFIEQLWSEANLKTFRQLPRAKDGWRGRFAAVSSRATENNWLLVLDVPECQVDAWLSDVGLFWDLVLKVSLGFSSHDQQAPVRQPLCKGNYSILPFETK